MLNRVGGGGVYTKFPPLEKVSSGCVCGVVGVGVVMDPWFSYFVAALHVINDQSLSRGTVAPISLVSAERAPFSEAISENSVKIGQTVQKL